MSRPTAPHGRTGRPRVTSRAQILAAARRLIDRDGWERLTIRRLAAEVGIGATTLYHHVRDKEDLLVLLLNDHAGQVERPRLPTNPRDRIVTAATAIHDTLVAWPWAAEVLATDGFIARLGEPALWMVDTILGGAVDHGCTPAQAVHIFRNIWYYTVGEILVRARSAHLRTEDRPADPAPTNFNPANLPHLAALVDQWAALAGQDTYPDGLRALVDGLLARATSVSP